MFKVWLLFTLVTILVVEAVPPHRKGPTDKEKQAYKKRYAKEDPEHKFYGWIDQAEKLGVYRKQPRHPDDWREQAQQALRKALELTPNTNVAKNVIIFIGDGMGIPTISAARVYQGYEKGAGIHAEEDSLSFESFPYVALMKTHEADWQTPDSAGTGTAILCGIKTNFNTIGVDDRATQALCFTEAGREVESILYWAEAAGKSTGIVTTTRITHATPAASYASTVLRYWENDQEMLPGSGACRDIARQLIEDGHDIEVVMGGGRSNFIPMEMEDPVDPNETGARGDSRDLIQEWRDDKVAKGKPHATVFTKQDLQAVDLNNTDYIFGLFSRDHLEFSHDRPDTEPSLPDMTEAALQILEKNDQGFVLVVEGGRIDQGHHKSMAAKALQETLDFSASVQKAIDMTNEEDTLIIVTADHSHVFGFGGYNPRGSNVLGKAIYPADDLMMFTTLLYGNGPGYNFTASDKGRPNIFGVDTTDYSYVQQSAVPLESETHGGEDVPVYARGPMAHLFHGVQEQHYIAHVAGYAACIGDNQEHCLPKEKRGFGIRGYTQNNSAKRTPNILTVFAIYLLFCLL